MRPELGSKQRRLPTPCWLPWRGLKFAQAPSCRPESRVRALVAGEPASTHLCRLRLDLARPSNTGLVLAKDRVQNCIDQWMCVRSVPEGAPAGRQLCGVQAAMLACMWLHCKLHSLEARSPVRSHFMSMSKAHTAHICRQLRALCCTYTGTTHLQRTCSILVGCTTCNTC